MLLLVQFGTVGFSVYEIKCSKSLILTYTTDNLGCICSEKKEVQNLTKKCCQKKIVKTCCKKNKDIQTKDQRASKKCCKSNLIVLKLFCDNFDQKLKDSYELKDLKNSWFQNLSTTSRSRIIKKHNNLAGKYKCNSPPFISADPRIFIQSLQI